MHFEEFWRSLAKTKAMNNSGTLAKILLFGFPF